MSRYPFNHIIEGLGFIDPNLTIVSDINRPLKNFSYSIEEKYLYDQDGNRLTSSIILVIEETTIARIASSTSLSTSLGFEEASRIYEQLKRYLKRRKKCLYDKGLENTFLIPFYSDE